MSARHARLTELFSEAIALGPDARTALIERVRASDRALADDLVALLAADAEAEQRGDGLLVTGGLLETVEASPAGQRAKARPRIRGYRVLDVIGEGGMGTVYAAEQRDPRRRVAIKILFARSPNAIARFKAEAQIMARLDHPGIARVLEAGDADGHPYLVMEHVDGETLDAYVQPLSRTDRLRLFLAICDAVHHAHINGVIHRDLKPSNVMVRDDRRVVILDFGVARIAADDGSTPGETRAGELVGTPLYMSPEQARLRPDAVDARSDVYTLGVILYELVAGKLPYEVRELPLPAVTTVICEDAPTPLGTLDPSLRGDLEAIATKALEKAPADRYQSVAALADDVRRFLGGEQVSVRAPGVVERARRFVRRRPLLAAGIAATIVATATLGAVITGLWLDARAARETSEHARSVAEGARADLEGRSNQLTLKQARALLERDPTEAVAWLKTLTTREVDAGAAWAVFDEAIARGVAKHVLHGHSDEVHWVEPFAGTEAFVTAGYEGRVILWEPPAFTPRTLLVAKRGRARVARPSPDGLSIAVGCDRGEAYVIARDGDVIAELAGHSGDVQHLAWSPDSVMLATGDDRGRLRIWTREASRELAASQVAIGALAFSADGSALIAGDHAGNIWLWDTRTWTVRTDVVGTDIAEVWTDGGRVAAVDANGTVHRWRVAGAALAGHTAAPTKQNTKHAVFAQRGDVIWLGGVGGAVMQIRAGEATTLYTHRAQVRSLVISADHRWLAAGADDGTLVLHDLSIGRAIPLRGHHGRIRSLAVTQQALLSADSQGIVRRWELASLAPRLLQGDAPATKLASDAKRLATIDATGTVLVWTLADGARTRLGRLEAAVTDVALAGDTVVTGTAEGDVTWWLAKPVTTKLPGVVTSIATSRDRVAVASKAGTIHLFTTNGAPDGELHGHTGGTEALAFDPSGQLLLSGGQDRVLRLWRRDGDRFVESATAAGPAGDTHFVAFTPGGDRAIAASDNGDVIAWRVRGQRLVDSRVLARHQGAVTALAIDSRFVVSAGRDGRVTRVPLAGGASVTAVLASPAIGLALGVSGDVHAVTRTTAVERVDGTRSIIEIDHGVHACIALSADRWVLAHEDGSIVITPLASQRLQELPAAIAATTHFTLPAD